MPAILYRNAAGQRLPSVTTVLKQLGWSTDALMWWAWNEGKEGRHFREASKAAASVGTIAHAGVEADVKGEEFSLDMLGLDAEDHEMVSACLGAWGRWKERNRVEFIDAEVSLVSEKHQFGGTLDIAAVCDARSIIDIKTSKGVYPDMLCQIAAYGYLWFENKEETIEEYHLLRLGKEDASFHHHSWPAKALREAWDVFLYALKIHGLQKIVKRRV